MKCWSSLNKRFHFISTTVFKRYLPASLESHSGERLHLNGLSLEMKLGHNHNFPLVPPILVRASISISALPSTNSIHLKRIQVHQHLRWPVAMERKLIFFFFKLRFIDFFFHSWKIDDYIYRQKKVTETRISILSECVG